MEDVDELFAEADGVALGDVDDAVEGVGDDEDGEGAVGELHVVRDFVDYSAVDVGAEADG